ncbi:hypothetical protein GGS21DRAFT_118557 [Xylaria nigripes]|nr:hypothetical protein GGS21DRAFT_118557 [Xylaria nigripes]
MLSHRAYTIYLIYIYYIYIHTLPRIRTMVIVMLVSSFLGAYPLFERGRFTDTTLHILHILHYTTLNYTQYTR